MKPKKVQLMHTTNAVTLSYTSQEQQVINDIVVHIEAHGKIRRCNADAGPDVPAADAHADSTR